jgi:hypothetical protein
VVLGVAHEEFLSLPLKNNDLQVIYDVKGILPANIADARL